MDWTRPMPEPEPASMHEIPTHSAWQTHTERDGGQTRLKQALRWDHSRGKPNDTHVRGPRGLCLAALGRVSSRSLSVRRVSAGLAVDRCGLRFGMSKVHHVREWGEIRAGAWHMDHTRSSPAIFLKRSLRVTACTPSATCSAMPSPESHTHGGRSKSTTFHPLPMSPSSTKPTSAPNELSGQYA
jgi:hypothetical protein